MSFVIETLPQRQEQPQSVEPRNRAPSKRHRTAYIAAIVALAVMAGLAVYKVRHGAHGVRYEMRRIDRGLIDETVLTTGTLEPVLTVNVGSQISGQVLNVYVDFNTPVKKDQLMARLDPRPLQAQHDQAQADVDNSRAAEKNAVANVENAQAGVATADAGIESARAALAVARAARTTADAQLEQARAGENKSRAQLEINRLTFERDSTLYAQHFIAPQDVDTAKANLLSARADVASAVGQVNFAKATVISADANVLNAQAALTTAVVKRESAVAQLHSAQAQRVQAAAQTAKSVATLRQIDINLAYVDIRAPVDGVVISRLVDPGNTVASSFQTPLMFTVGTDLHKMQVWANVDETDVSRTFLDQDVSFTVFAWPNETFRGGKVVQIRNAPQIVQNVVTYQVLIDIRNEDLKLRPGMTANLTLEVASRASALRVPNTALRFRPSDAGLAVEEPPAAVGCQRVWMVAQNGALTCRDIHTGITDGVNTEVVDNALQVGDKVLVGVTTKALEPASTLRPQLPRT